MLTTSCLFVQTFLFGLISAQAYIYPTVGLNTTWIANTSDVNHIRFDLAGTSVSVIPILLRGHNGSSFACGFYGQAFAESYFFAVFIVQTNLRSIINANVTPAVVRSANRNRPVGNQATLELTEGGDLVLKDADGFVAWSTQTSGKSVAGINLTDTGNLVLFDENNAAVWESFDDPKDTLLPGQKLRVGQKLSDSVTNMSEPGLYSLSLTIEGLFAQIETDPPQVYLPWPINFPNTSNDSNYVEFTQGQVELFVNFVRNRTLFPGYHYSSVMQYLKFKSDGHLRAYRHYQNGWDTNHDSLTDYISDCGYPMVCGQYGMCDANGNCRCPDGFFKPLNDSDLRLGCSEMVPLSCEYSRFQSFMEIGWYTYFTYRADPQSAPDLGNTDKESCKKACANNCSCRAAIFERVEDSVGFSGSCYLVSQVFSLAYPIYPIPQSTVLLKVQNPRSEIQIRRIRSEPPNYLPSESPNHPPSEPPNHPNTDEAHASPKNGKMAHVVLIVIISSGLGSLLVFIFLNVVEKWLFRTKGAHEVEEEKGVDEAEEDCLDLATAPKRFNYDDLQAITEDFNKRLGEGGFGSVYQGTLANGTKVAVKHLKVLSQSKKSFLAEVETIGNIHHVNLVRLVGFCAEKSHGTSFAI